jgi:ribosomal protein S18 acetylase RimI-like enzyme
MPLYKIEKANKEDLSLICHLFEEAIAFQKANGYIGWQSYDREYLKSDIEKGLLFNVMKDNNVIGIFCICFSDVLIWRVKERGDALYLHRIVLDQRFKGEKVFKRVHDWATNFAKASGLKYIRMDTWANNSKIIAYYESYGYTFIENYTTSDSDALPIQHRNLKVALLEYKL